MGCGTSKVDTTLKEKAPTIQMAKSMCLIFGMPDAGQTNFVKSIQGCFSDIGMKEGPFVFYLAPTEREYRTSWIEEYDKHERVIASFFFVDVSSVSGVLFSVKTFNWMRSQLIDQPPPHIVGLVRDQNELNNFSLLKEKLSPGIGVSTFNDLNPSDIQKYIEYITGCAARQTISVGKRS
ncbi:hypothetical protein M9Y10_021689 [Tritrichomonas musculus]|uniref:Uncharacterized protein n=1 Tax=Tritrichomonas musculus TaxID=1915356 RepID=A0ABR2KQ49_9EUKA